MDNPKASDVVDEILGATVAPAKVKNGRKNKRLPLYVSEKFAINIVYVNCNKRCIEKLRFVYIKSNFFCLRMAIIKSKRKITLSFEQRNV